MSDELKIVGDTAYHGVGTNKLFHIGEVYAVISEDAKGNEGICGYIGGELSATPLPFVFADASKLHQWMPIIRKMAADGERFGAKLKIVKFTQRVEIEEIKP